jgi:hypothetical protein
VVVVPAGTETGQARVETNLPLPYVSLITLEGDSKPFTVNQDPLGPGICQLFNTRLNTEGEPYNDDNPKNGQYDVAGEQFRDLNNNGLWDAKPLLSVGLAGDPVELDGDRFEASPRDGKLTFYKDKILSKDLNQTSTWDNLKITADVPDGTITGPVKVTKTLTLITGRKCTGIPFLGICFGGDWVDITEDRVVESNEVNFSILPPGACKTDADCQKVAACFGSHCDVTKGFCTPVINNFTPNKGAIGTWVTIAGCYFGCEKGNVTFTDNKDALWPDPALCGSTWTCFADGRSEVVAEVPNKAIKANPVSASYEAVLDGNNAYIDTGSDSSLDLGNTFTVEAWIKPSALVNYAGIVSKVISDRNPQSAADYSYMLVCHNDGTIGSYDGGAGGWTFSTNAGITAGNWYHIVWVLNSGTIYYYVNGAPYGSAAFSYTDHDIHNTFMGSWYIPANSYDFNGIIDEVRIYKGRVLTTGEIVAHYAAGLGLYGTDTTDMVLGLHFDEGGGLYTDDYSGNHNVGTLVGGVTWAAGEKASEQAGEKPTSDTDDDAITGPITLIRSDGQSTDTAELSPKDFTINDEIMPGICKFDPNFGPRETKFKILGQNFGEDKDKVTFAHKKIHPPPSYDYLLDISSFITDLSGCGDGWSDSTICLTVPTGAPFDLDPVWVVRGAKDSNKVSFDVREVVGSTCDSAIQFLCGSVCCNKGVSCNPTGNDGYGKCDDIICSSPTPFTCGDICCATNCVNGSCPGGPVCGNGEYEGGEKCEFIGGKANFDGADDVCKLCGENYSASSCGEPGSPQQCQVTACTNPQKEVCSFLCHNFSETQINPSLDNPFGAGLRECWADINNNKAVDEATKPPNPSDPAPDHVFRFDESAGSSTLAEVGGQTGDIAGAAFIGGEVGYPGDHALELGEGDTVNFSNSLLGASSQPTSFELWVKPEKTADMKILTQPLAYGSLILATTNDGRFRFNLNYYYQYSYSCCTVYFWNRCWSWGTCYSTPASYTDTAYTDPALGGSYTPGTWYHLAVTFDYNLYKEYKIYLNGELVGTLASSSFTYTPSGSTVMGGSDFAGTVDDFKAYLNKTLDATKIKKHYDEILKNSTNEYGTPIFVSKSTGEIIKYDPAAGQWKCRVGNTTYSNSGVEECDDADVGGLTCTDFDQPPYGSLSCSDNCRINTSCSAAPQVVDDPACKDNTQSPAPYKDSKDACVNAAISARFNMMMNDTSFNGNILVEKCADETGGICNNWSPNFLVATAVQIFTDRFVFTPDKNLEKDSWYKVTLKGGSGGIKSEAGASLVEDYIWTFRTRNNSNLCTIDHITVEPSEKTLLVSGLVPHPTQDYSAEPVAANCNILTGYSFAWSSSNSDVATVDGGHGKTATATAQDVDEGETYIKASTEGKDGSGKLIVTTGEKPKVENCLPTGDPDKKVCRSGAANVCLNAAVEIDFSRVMDENSFDSETEGPKIFLEVCNNGNCGPTRTPTTILSAVQDGKTIVILTPTSLLNENQLYKVTVQGGTGGVKNFGGMELGEPNDGNDFTWTFTTSPAGAGTTYCQVSKVEITVAPPGQVKTEDFFTCAGRDDCFDDQKSGEGFGGVQHKYSAQAMDSTGLPLQAIYTWIHDGQFDPQGAVEFLSLDGEKKEQLSGQELKEIYVTGKPVQDAEATVPVAALGDCGPGIDCGYADSQVRVIIFLCQNPWPAISGGTWSPYRDVSTNCYTCSNNTSRFCLKNSDCPENGTCRITSSCVNSNFETYYCRDAGEINTIADDLPALKHPPVVLPGVPGADLFKEFLFPRDPVSSPSDNSSDAIGVRILRNIDHLPPLKWYTENVPRPGSPSIIDMDGYTAVRDGRTIYANAANLIGYCGVEDLTKTCKQDPDCPAGQICSNENLCASLTKTTCNQDEDCYGGFTCVLNESFYTNIYLISYNENPNSNTLNIYDQMMKYWRFNANLEFDLKEKLIRDTRRLEDLNAIKDLLEIYRAKFGKYPTLDAGSYIKGHALSIWPSWQAVLGNALGVKLPLDPLNKLAMTEAAACSASNCPDKVCVKGNPLKLGKVCLTNDACGTADEEANCVALCCESNKQCVAGDQPKCSPCPPGYDPLTCWNEKTGQFAFP